MTNECQPVLISLGMMPDLFGVAQQTCHRWNTQAGGPGRLPKPDLVVGNLPVWFEETIREWAQTRRNKLTIDETEMRRICQSQLLG